MNKIQYAEKRNRVQYENFEHEERNLILPDRLPKLSDIVAMFVQGRPIDANLQRHLDYNELERNPVLQKGVDLADIDKIAKATKMTLDQVQEELERAALAKQSKTEQLQDPTIKAPEPVVTE